MALLDTTQTMFAETANIHAKRGKCGREAEGDGGGEGYRGEGSMKGTCIVGRPCPRTKFPAGQHSMCGL